MPRRITALPYVKFRKPTAPVPARRSGKATAARLLNAAVACGLTRAQAVDLLHLTLAVGIAIFEAPANEAQLRADLASNTRRLVVAVRAGRAVVRRAA